MDDINGFWINENPCVLLILFNGHVMSTNTISDTISALQGQEVSNVHGLKLKYIFANAYRNPTQDVHITKLEWAVDYICFIA